MIIKPEDVIKAAEAELGYHEKASNKNLDDKTANAGSANYTKYARDLAAAGYYNGNKNGYEWCDVFVDHCFYIACGRDRKTAEYVQCQSGPLGAGVGYSMGYYKSAGRCDLSPKVGDQVFFRYSGSGVDHTGIVTAVTPTQITTVEGNSSDTVRKKYYPRDYYAIIGYGHPRYDTDAARKEETTVNIELSEISKGSTGAQVKTLQRLLKSLGYKDAEGSVLKIDGDFGSRTEYALKRYQTAKKLGVDGICGVKSWNKLLKA